jgi:hypothetical protein
VKSAARFWALTISFALAWSWSIDRLARMVETNTASETERAEVVSTIESRPLFRGVTYVYDPTMNTVRGAR